MCYVCDVLYAVLYVSRVNVRFDPKQIYNKVFFALGVSLGCTRPLKKSLPKFDPGKLVN